MERLLGRRSGVEGEKKDEEGREGRRRKEVKGFGRPSSFVQMR